MKSKLQPLLVICLSLALPTFPECEGQEVSMEPSYYYNLCFASRCGNIPLAYPFGLPRFCHHPSLTPTCPGDGHVHLSSEGQTGSFRVLGNLTVDATGATIYVASDSLFNCGPVSKHGYSTNPTIFSLPNTLTYGTHLNCTRPPTSGGVTLQQASCLGCKDEGNVCYYTPGLGTNFPECESFFIFVPVEFNVSAEKDLRGYLQKGYPIRYSKAVECQSCETSGGICGTSINGSFVCFCANSVHRTNCSDGIIEDLKAWLPQHEKSGSSTTLIIALSASASTVILCALATLGCIFAYKRKCRSPHDSENQTDNRIITQDGVKDLVDDISATRYSYSQIKICTNNFATKLAEGGSGNVYKGIIKKNKCEIPVAVKVLKASKQNEKQFMNEVATVGRIHHNNLIRLFGYCAQGKKRALVYEFMDNGSLDKYIYESKKRGGEEDNNYKSLTPKQMYTIALDTAWGILYLHQGCRSRILHCDIKPHNVLLDSNFSAKVADFGLARMADKDRSHISLSVARGTPGYAAPEMWSKAYGPITEKSDVYSYGMLILEMAGERKNNDSEAAAPNQVYFPEWILQKVKNRKSETKQELGNIGENVADIKGDHDEEITEKICLVGLWCIQHIPANRPSMTEVIQMLEGNVEITPPPHPFPLDEGSGHPSDQATSTIYLSAMNESV